MPTHFWAAPYGGSEQFATNPSRLYPAGDGEAMVWFLFDQPGDTVDGVRIRAGDGSKAGTRVVADYPIHLNAGDETASASGKPAWLTRLKQADAQDTAYRKAMNQPESAGEKLFFAGFMLLMAIVGIFGVAGPEGDCGAGAAAGAWRPDCPPC